MTISILTRTPTSALLTQAAPGLFTFVSLLGLSACGGAVDETSFTTDADEASTEEKLGAPTGDTGDVGSLEQPLFGSDACRSADIRVLNSRSDVITVRRIEYYNASEGRWDSEDLANRTMNPGVMEFWTPNLEHAENDWIYSFNVIFDHPGHNGHSEHINTPDQTCIPGRVFFLEVP